MLPSQVVSTIRAQFNESTADFCTDDEIYGYLWQAETMINNLTQCAESVNSSITTVSGTAEYALPGTVLFVKRVQWDYVRLKKIDFRELENQEGQAYGSVIALAQPYAYYLFGANLGLYPTPNMVRTVIMNVIVQPTICTVNSISFTIPQLFHHLLPDYALFRMFSKDQEDNRSVFYKTQWEENLKIAVQTWESTKTSDRIYVVKDSDRFPNVYPGMI